MIEKNNKINWRSYLACIVSSTASHAAFFSSYYPCFSNVMLCDAFPSVSLFLKKKVKEKCYFIDWIIMNEWMNEWLDGWMDVCMNEKMKW